jgi:hypothetical protein
VAVYVCVTGGISDPPIPPLQVVDGLAGQLNDVGVQHYGCTALGNLLDDGKARVQALDRVRPHVFNAVAAHPADADVQKAAAALMTKLSKNANGQVQPAERSVKHVLRGFADHLSQYVLHSEPSS